MILSIRKIVRQVNVLNISEKIRKGIINFSGKSVFPKIPDREPIPMKDDRVQNYQYLTAAEYRRLFEDEDSSEQKIARTAYISMEHKGKVYHLFDASRIPFGKIIQPAVYLLQGKHKPNFRRNEINKDDIVIIVNASEMFLTGRKMFYKKVKYHTGYIGHLRNVDYKHFMQNKPEQLFFWNVRKQLPKVKTRDDYLENLYVYRDYQHEFMQFLPSFLKPAQQVDQTYNRDMVQEIIESNSKIIFKSEEEVPTEFKHLAYEEDLSLLEDENTLFQKKLRLDTNKSQLKKLYKQYKRKINRYKRYSFKQPKNRDPNLNNKSFMIKSDRYIHKHKLHHYFDNNDIDASEEEVSDSD